MTDFWFNIIWTVLIALATVLTDWIAAKFIGYTRGFTAIQRAADQAVADDLKLKDIRGEIERALKRVKYSLVWGADLVTVAIGLDLATLGLWTTNKSLFPFFQRWNVGTINREIQIWLLIMVVHLVILLMSIVFKHLHGDKIETYDPSELASAAKINKWIPQNRWLLASNSLGFLALLSSFMIMTNTF